MPVTLAQYQKMTTSQRKKLKRDEIETILDEVIDNDVSGETIKGVIAKTINENLDEKFETFKTQYINNHKQEMSQMNETMESLRNENNMIKKAVVEQQKFLEHLRRDKNKNNVFITGIPCKMKIDGNETQDSKVIIQYALKVALPNIESDMYRVLKDFEPREGHTRHSTKLELKENETKKKLMEGACKLKSTPGEDNPLRRIYIKNDQPPLSKRENDRLFTKMLSLKDAETDENEKKAYKISFGKLYKNDTLMDEFNLNNQLFQ